MRVAILTLPLHTNYGGIVQAYALQNILQRIGHDVSILKLMNSAGPKKISFRFHYPFLIKEFFLHFHTNISFINEANKRTLYQMKIKGINKFVKSHILIKPFYILGDGDYEAYDAIIVGSDQVWRPIYAGDIELYYLKFLKGRSKIRKIAYGVSFGTTDWEYTEQQTIECAKLAHEFDLITVREDSGIALCQKYLGVKATQVLDPTMLLDKDDYVAIVKQEKAPKSNGNLFVYILDDNEQKQSYVQEIVSKLELTPFAVMPTVKELEVGPAYPGIPIWLRSFMDAQFVVTDSFHGCVFSIIFNKPFIAIGNKKRGQARFDSLLRMFHLQDRLVDVENLSMDCISSRIDWRTVNVIRKKMQQMSISLLSNSLK